MTQLWLFTSQKEKKRLIITNLDDELSAGGNQSPPDIPDQARFDEVGRSRAIISQRQAELLEGFVARLLEEGRTTVTSVDRSQSCIGAGRCGGGQKTVP